MARRPLFSYTRRAGLPFVQPSSTPAWLPEGAVAYADFVNGRYWKDGAECSLTDLVIQNGNFGSFSPAMVTEGVGLQLGEPCFDLGALLTSGFTVVATVSSNAGADLHASWFVGATGSYANDNMDALAGAQKFAGTFLPGTRAKSIDGAAVVTTTVEALSADAFGFWGEDILLEVAFYAPVPNADLPALSAL